VAVELADKYTPLAARRSVTYRDFVETLDVNPDTGDLLVRTDENDISRTIRNLILTNRGERLFQPDIGSNVNRILFEPMTPQTEVKLSEYITSTIENFEPRASLIAVNIIGDYDLNTYSINIVYNLLNKAEPVQLNFILNRVR
jgi:phage baseplate assembly protein W